MPGELGESYKYPGYLGNFDSPLADDRAWQRSGEHNITTKQMAGVTEEATYMP